MFGFTLNKSQQVKQLCMRVRLKKIEMQELEEVYIEMIHELKTKNELLERENKKLKRELIHAQNKHKSIDVVYP